MKQTNNFISSTLLVYWSVSVRAAVQVCTSCHFISVFTSCHFISVFTSCHFIIFYVACLLTRVCKGSCTGVCIISFDIMYLACLLILIGCSTHHWLVCIVLFGVTVNWTENKAFNFENDECVIIGLTTITVAWVQVFRLGAGNRFLKISKPAGSGFWIFEKQNKTKMVKIHQCSVLGTPLFRSEFCHFSSL